MIYVTVFDLNTGKRKRFTKFEDDDHDYAEWCYEMMDVEDDEFKTIKYY